MMSEVNSKMSSLDSRIASFYLWIMRDQVRLDHDVIVDNCQNNKVSRVDLKAASFLGLARAGFYYSDKDEVKCFCCGVAYNVWGKESPVAVHRILNMNCPVVDPDNQDASAEKLFQAPTSPSSADLGTSNHFCSPSRQPSDDESTLESGPCNAQIRSDNININTNAISYRPNETPPTNTSTYVVDNAEFQNVRRNLFSEEDTETRPRVHNSDNRNNLNYQIVPRRFMDHSAEFTGKISHPKIGEKKSMVRESLRLLTFPDPTDEKSEVWAKCGFRYLADEEDCVQCVYCGGQASFYENNIKNIHQRISPKGRYQCPMISGIDVGDVTRELEELVKNKLCQRNTEVSCDQRNLYPMYHPQFKTVNKRLESYKHWSIQFQQTKFEMARAGFFYTGVSDKVACFSCGVALFHWQQTANSWQQHARVSSTCHFILHEKGPEFIRQMAAIPKLVEVDPLVTEPLRNIGDLVIPDPYPSTLTRDLLAAYASCGRYPDVTMLEAAVLADGQLKKKEDIIDHHIDIIEKNAKQLGQIEKVLTTKDQQIKSTVCEINQRHCLQLNDKDMEILEKEQIVQQKEQIVHQHREQLHQQKQIVHQQGQIVHQQGQQLHLKDQIVHQQGQQLHQQKQIVHQKEEQLHQHKQKLNHKEQQLCKKNRENLLLNCSRHELRTQLHDRDSIINQQQAQLQDLKSRLQNEVMQHQRREATLFEERNEYLLLSLEIEQQKHEVEEEIKRYEKELSALLNEYSRLKKNGKGDNTVESDSSNMCVFCISKDRNIMFKPCKHICCCEQCLPNFKGKPCPYCKTNIQGWQVVFLP